MVQLLADIRTAAQSDGSIETFGANIDRLRFNVPVESKRIFPTGRLDYNVTDRHRLTTTVNYNWFRDTPDTLNNRDATFPGFPVAAGQKSQRVAVSNTLRSALGSNFVNEFRVGYSGAPVEFFNEFNVGMFTGSVANTKGFSMAGAALGTVDSGLTGPNPGLAPQSRNATDLAFDNTLTWLKGNHNITAGGSWSRFSVWLDNSSLVPSASFRVSATEIFLNADPANSVFTTANMAAATGVTPNIAQLRSAQQLFAILTGRVAAIGGDARLDENTGQYVFMGVGTQRARMHEGGFYIQDQWRVKPNVTVNAGLRYTVQLPFTAQNNSYSTPRLEDVCGKSGINAQTGLCNLFQPGFEPGKQRPEFFQLGKGENPYNTDWDNLAPNVGLAWTVNGRTGILGALLSDEFVVRAGWSRAYSREGLGRFTGQFNANPGVIISANRTQGLGNIIPAGSSAPLLFRNDAPLGPPAFPDRPVFPMIDEPTSDIRLFDPNIEVPFADSWSAGVQRQLTRNTALEVRYVGTFSRDLWATRNFNEINIFENDFVNEFRRAQQNLQANLAAGLGGTFRFTGAPGTQPLPVMLAYLNARSADQAGNPAAYTGTLWQNSTLLNQLALRNPNPFGMASTFVNNFRGNALAAGLPANFFQANPDHTGGAFITLNSHKTRYNALQLELRRRLANGVQFLSNYTFGNGDETVFLTHRRDIFWQRDANSPGDLTHQFKANVIVELPFGQGRRFARHAGGVLDRIVGGWQVVLNARIQSGTLRDVGGVRLVGWTEDDVKKAFKLRFDDEAGQIFMWPQDVIENTIRAWSFSPTSPTGFSGEAPTGRYFAPANGPDCIEVNAAASVGECPGAIRSLIVTGPRFNQYDLRVSKQTRITGRANFEFAAEILNVFNHANFIPNGQNSGSVLSNFLVTTLTGTNTSRVIQLVSRVNW